MRIFAEDTSVPISRTRVAIDDLLRDWGCVKLSWADEYDERRAQLQFVWNHEGSQYLARFTLALPKVAEVKKELKAASRNRWRDPSDRQVADAVAQGERSAYRVLLLWLKGALNAVQAGIVTAEAVFLPWLVGTDGRTVADVMVPRMQELLRGSAERLLPPAGGK
jgi:hypothetical protein